MLSNKRIRKSQFAFNSGFYFNLIIQSRLIFYFLLHVFLKLLRIEFKKKTPNIFFWNKGIEVRFWKRTSWMYL